MMKIPPPLPLLADLKQTNDPHYWETAGKIYKQFLMKNLLNIRDSELKTLFKMLETAFGAREQVIQPLHIRGSNIILAG